MTGGTWELTEEQQAIVDHDFGPALVFANEHREPKRLSLTRGFGGGVHAEAGAEDTGVHIAELIGQAFQDGHTPVDVAVVDVAVAGAPVRADAVH